MLWYITYDDAHMCSLCILNNLPMVWKHPNIVLLMSHFFPPLFGSSQRSTSNSMRWNQALLSVSHWCITRPRRSCLCKHTLSRAMEDVRCWPHLTNSLWCIFRGEGLCDGRDRLCSHNDFLVANEEGQAIKSGRPLRQHHYLTLSQMINELK